MKVAVITPYFNEPLETIRRAHDSVLAQTHPCLHVLVADGERRQEIDGWDARHMAAAGPHRDFGNTARGIGAISALNLGAEAVAFLDADNWYAPDHVESLAQACQERGAQVAFSDRTVMLVGGTELEKDDVTMRKRAYVDTNCFFITDKAAFLMPLWAMIDPQIAEAGDRFMYWFVRSRGVPYTFTNRPTLFYESRWPNHYLRLGLEPPPDAHEIPWPEVKARYSHERQTRRLGFQAPKLSGNDPEA